MITVYIIIIGFELVQYRIVVLFRKETEPSGLYSTVLVP
jgi:hypothetical protein